MNTKETAALLRLIRGIYANFSIEPPVEAGGPSPTVVMWGELLEDVAFDDAVAALKEHAKTETWPPTPAHLRALDPGRWRRDYGNGGYELPAGWHGTPLDVRVVGIGERVSRTAIQPGRLGFRD